MNNRVYITTSIPYVNAKPHLGFALELVQADAIARYRRLLGHTVRLQTGTDENALKNVLAARAQGITTRELVERNSRLFRELADALAVGADSFIRTTEERHRQAVRRFWQALRPEDLSQRHYTGLYCTGCEDFYLGRDLVDGCCPDHKVPPVPVKENNHFFSLSGYASRLEGLLESKRIRIVPDSRRNEILRFVRDGLQDISVSRVSERSGGWGIPVPGDSSQVVYVWIDALINYVSGLGFGTSASWTDVWTEDTTKIHVIGKNVWKFHAVYWPALLLSAGLPVPDQVVVHGFLTENGEKISKSRGPSIDPFDCIGRYGVDAVRYYLLRAISPFQDGDVSTQRLRQVYNSDLANGLGNLVSRLTALCAKTDYGRFEPPPALAPPPGYREAWSGYEFDKALQALWSVIARVNADIQRVRPWELLRAKTSTELHEHLSRWLTDLARIGHWLEPFLPHASAHVRALLSEQPIRACAPPFPRVE